MGYNIFSVQKIKSKTGIIDCPIRIDNATASFPYRTKSNCNNTVKIAETITLGYTFLHFLVLTIRL